MASLQRKNFTQLAELKDDCLSSGYVHSTFETWKIKAKTAKGAKIDYKANVSAVPDKAELVKCALKDELKVQFPFGKENKYTAFFGARTAPVSKDGTPQASSDLKFAFDFGSICLFDKHFNLFTNLKTNDQFKKFAFRFGANYNGSKCESNTRFETGCGSSVCLTQRTFLRHEKFFYGFVGKIALDNFCPCLYDAVFGFEQKDVKFYLQHKSPALGAGCCPKGSCGFKLGTVTATGVYNKDKLSFGLSATKDSNGQVFTAGAQCDVNDKLTVRGKLNCCLNLEVAAKYKCCDLLTATGSFKLPLKQGAKCVDFTKIIPFPLGFEFELNI